MAATTAAVVAGAASAASSVSSMQGGGGAGQAPRWKRKADKALYGQAQGAANSMSVAPFNQDQLNAMQGVRDSQGYLDGDMAGAQDTAKLLAQGVSPEDIAKFYNPFEDDVIGSYLQDVDRMHGTEDLRVNDAAEAAGAFGGDREAVYRAVSQGEIDRNAGANLAGIRSRGYELASGNAMNNQSLRLQGNDQLQQLINSRRQNRYQDINALYNIGTAGQAQDQAQRDLATKRIQFLRDQLSGAPGGQANQGSGVDPIAAGLAGYQGGYRGVTDLISSFGGGYAAPGDPNYGNSTRRAVGLPEDY